MEENILNHRLREFIENETRSCSMDYGCITPEDVYRMLVEMHPNVASAHPVVAALETAVLLPLQDWILHNYGEFAARRKIRIG